MIQPNQIHPSRPWGSTRPRWTAEFASTSLWGRYAAATIQCPKNQIQTYFRMFLEERKITLLPAFLDTTVCTMVQWKLYARDHIRTMKKGPLKKVSIQWRWHTKIKSLGPLINPHQKCPEWVIPLYYLISKVSVSTNWVPFNQLTIKRESWISQLIHITKTAGRSVTRANLLVHCTLLG